MQGRLTKFRILFYCLLDGGQFILSPCLAFSSRVPCPNCLTNLHEFYTLFRRSI